MLEISDNKLFEAKLIFQPDTLSFAIIAKRTGYISIVRLTIRFNTPPLEKRNAIEGNIILIFKKSNIFKPKIYKNGISIRIFYLRKIYEEKLKTYHVEENLKKKMEEKLREI